MLFAMQTERMPHSAVQLCFKEEYEVKKLDEHKGEKAEGVS